MNRCLVSKNLLGLLFLVSCARAELVTINNEAEFNDQIVKSPKPAVVKFAASWCGVCQGVKKPFEQLAKDPELADIAFFTVDIDHAKSLADKHGIVGVPTFIFMSQGNKVDEQTGVQDMKKFKNEMRTHIRTKFPKNAQTSVDATQEEPSAPAKPVVIVEPDQEAQAQGIVDSIVRGVKLVIAVIVGLIKYTIDAIKSLFSK